MEVSFDISGKVAVLTGAGGIICGVMAKEFAKKGARVALLDLFPEKAQAIADEISAGGGEAIAVRTDVLDRASLEEARSAVLERFGRVDILVNGAGGTKKLLRSGRTTRFSRWTSKRSNGCSTST
jgi:NAD(P)-dependent dehydrogenase (short-subunit alcohol dehydrogenase family)